VLEIGWKFAELSEPREGMVIKGCRYPGIKTWVKRSLYRLSRRRKKADDPTAIKSPGKPSAEEACRYLEDKRIFWSKDPGTTNIGGSGSSAISLPEN